MSPISGRGIITENMKTMLICIDSYENFCAKGKIFHGMREDGAQFANLMQLLLNIESIIDDTGFPKATTEKRRFHSFAHQEKSGESFGGEYFDFSMKKGALATFRLKVMFRHNASWQGTVAWLEGSTEEPFRSALEFMMLMHSAMVD